MEEAEKAMWDPWRQREDILFGKKSNKISYDNIIRLMFHVLFVCGYSTKAANSCPHAHAV
jgi:hypothetical protein